MDNQSYLEFVSICLFAIFMFIMLDIYLHSLCLDRIDSTDLRYVLSFPPLAKQFDIKLIVSTCSSAVYNCKSVFIAAARYSVISLCCTTCC